MVNTDEFIKRLEIILEFFGLSASAFADKIGVQRSGLSHLLSGRNKPSLDFILKIIEHFPEVDLYWILNGKGTFPTTNQKPNRTAIPPVSETTVGPAINEKVRTEADINLTSASIAKIVVFYDDGTFAEYIPRT